VREREGICDWLARACTKAASPRSTLSFTSACTFTCRALGYDEYKDVEHVNQKRTTKEGHIQRKRPTDESMSKRLMPIKRDQDQSKETKINQKRPTSIKRDLFQSKETYINQQRLIFIKRDLDQTKETKVNQKRPMSIKRDQNQSESDPDQSKET